MTGGIQSGGTDGQGNAFAALSAAIDGAQTLHEGEADYLAAPQQPEPETEDDGESYRERVLREVGMPPGLPIVPLGKNGLSHYYLDALNQLVELSARDHSRNNLSALFSPDNDVLELYWPRKKEIKKKDADGNETTEIVISGFSADKCADALFRAIAARRRVFDPGKSLRGVGCWRRDDGSLVWHCGDRVLINGRVEQPGEIDGFVYPGAPAILPPAKSNEGDGKTAAHEIYKLLKTWNWERKDTDARLLLGWIAAAFVGGALAWRPMAWLTGDAAAGKSTVHHLLALLFGPESIVQAANTTAAGIYQEVGYSSLPVAIDELEPEADDKRTSDVIGLARLASSGGVLLRGGKDHKGTQFQARSCFMFSSILIPPLTDAERSRMAILSLRPLPSDAKEPVLDPKHFRLLGRLIQRRMMDQWHRLDETVSRFKDAVRKAGHGSRAANQFGTLLACSELLLFDGLPSEEAQDEWTQKLDAKHWSETRDIRSDADACLDWLLQGSPEAWKGGQRVSIFKLLHELWKDVGDASMNKEVLGQCGLAFVQVRKNGVSGHYLAVHGNHRGLIEIFRPTRWAGKPGQMGGWVQSIRRLPGAISDHTARIGGKPDKCTLIPLEVIMKDIDDKSENEKKERELYHDGDR